MVRHRREWKRPYRTPLRGSVGRFLSLLICITLHLHRYRRCSTHVFHSTCVRLFLLLLPCRHLCHLRSRNMEALSLNFLRNQPTVLRQCRTCPCSRRRSCTEIDPHLLLRFSKPVHGTVIYETFSLSSCSVPFLPSSVHEPAHSLSWASIWCSS